MLFVRIWADFPSGVESFPFGHHLGQVGFGFNPSILGMYREYLSDLIMKIPEGFLVLLLLAGRWCNLWIVRIEGFLGGHGRGA